MTRQENSRGESGGPERAGDQGDRGRAGCTTSIVLLYTFYTTSTVMLSNAITSNRSVKERSSTARRTESWSSTHAAWQSHNHFVHGASGTPRIRCTTYVLIIHKSLRLDARRFADPLWNRPSRNWRCWSSSERISGTGLPNRLVHCRYGRAIQRVLNGKE